MKTRLAADNKTLWNKSLKDLPKFISGKPSSYRKIELPIPATKTEIVSVRKALHATQKTFASLVGVSVESVRAWEAGRRVPEGPASKLIRLLSKDRRLANRLAAA